MRLTERMKKIMNRHGEQYTVGTYTYYGFFKPLDTGTMRTYLDDVEAMSVQRPGLLLITYGEAQIAVDDTITRDGRTYTVLKVFNQRADSAILAKTVILA